LQVVTIGGGKEGNMAKFLGTSEMSVDKPEVLEEVQPRKRLSEEVIRDYLDVYNDDPSRMPPLRTFKVGRREVLTRGFHRITALRRSQIKTVMVERYQGTMEEAVEDAMLDNREHGLRYTRADKVVIASRLLTDPKHEQLSVAELARKTGFSRPFISGLCRALERKAAKDPDVEVVEEVEESYEGEEALQDLSPTDRMKEFNKEVDDVCRKVQEFWRLNVKPLGDKHAWIRDGGRLTTATQTLSTALQTLKTCKGHDVCPKCNGDGCKVCRHSGFVDRGTYEAASF
jgi:hypothetical protein